MNTLSKVFVVVNLVFAIAFCFMTLTLYSKKVDWKESYKDEVDAHELTTEEKDAEIGQLTTDLRDRQEDIRALNQTNGELETNVVTLKQKLTTETDRFIEADGERRLLSDRVEGMREELNRRYEHIDRMHTIILNQQIALDVAEENMQNALTRCMEMENDLNNSRQQLVAVRKEKARLEKDLHHNSWIIDKLMEHGVRVRDIVYVKDDQPAPPIRGKVLAVRPKVNICMLSVGSDDQVRKGYRFTVFRDDEYIGRIEVEKVYNDMSSARLLPEWMRGEIKEGDDASTTQR